MLKVHVWHHIDGDHLSVVDVPWYMPIYEWLANRFCPCCGISGLLFKFYGNAEDENSLGSKLADKHYYIWNWLLEPTYKLEKELYKTPIESGCIASQAIWKKKEACFRSDCENCWDLRDDAYSNEE